MTVHNCTGHAFKNNPLSKHFVNFWQVASPRIMYFDLFTSLKPFEEMKYRFSSLNKNVSAVSLLKSSLHSV